MRSEALLHWRISTVGGEGASMRPRRSRPVAAIRSSAFKGFRFPPEMIVLSVRWYLRYGLSYRDVEELLGERGIEVDHVTIYRWVQRFTPLLADAAGPCRHRVGGHQCPSTPGEGGAAGSLFSNSNSVKAVASTGNEGENASGGSAFRA